MVILAALPGIVRELLVTGKLVKPGNFSATVHFLGYRLRKVGLVCVRRRLAWHNPLYARPFRQGCQAERKSSRRRIALSESVSVTTHLNAAELSMTRLIRRHGVRG